MKGNSNAVHRYRREHYFAKPPAAIWPFVSDTARLWELNGFAPYRIDERVDSEGRVRRFVRGKVGPFPARWEEDFGDAPAYNLVRDHFSFLSDRVQRNHGFVVKTVGDAVIAAFSRPDHAVRAALAIQDDVASFNAARGAGATPIVLKLGLHAGPCIAVTTGETLDYFGATVNVAARLENQCRGGQVIVSEAVAGDAETAEALADRTRIEETARLRGVSAPVRFVRITGRREN